LGTSSCVAYEQLKTMLSKNKEIGANVDASFVLLSGSGAIIAESATAK